MTKQKKTKTVKEREYDVTLDIFFMEHVYVTAKNKKEAFEKAKEESKFVWSEGAEATLFEIEEIK